MSQPTPPPRPATPRGFALIITIVLVAFLVLILVGLATFTRVETQVADNSQQLAKARQNALMALNLAVGQLQKHTGPDQRVTATADVLTPAGHTWATPAVNSTAAQYTTARTSDQTSIEAKWAAASNRHWTGVWKNKNSDPSDYKADDPAAFNPEPLLQSWLVSGNESSATGDAYKPTDTVAGLTATSSPLDQLGTPAKPYRLLVKASASADSAPDPATDPRPLDRAVTAPEIAITSTGVPGTDGTATTIGHYAWWVGDEGVKARANLADPYFKDGSAAAKTTRFQSAQRPAVEAMHADLSPLDPTVHDTSAAAYQQFTDNLAKVVAPSQLAYLDATPTFSKELKKGYHDLSITSRGVLADTKHGGLKSDLTYLFGQTGLPDFRTALGKAYDTTLAGASNSVFSSYATPYSERPSAAEFNTSPGIFTNSPTWEQLWSFANMGATAGTGSEGVFNTAGTEAGPRRQTSIRQGLYPLVMQTKLFYGLRIDPATQEVWADASVVVVLANPYNIKLAPADYTLRLTGGSARLRFGTTTPLADYSPLASSVPGQVDVSGNFPGKTEFIVRDTQGIDAGQAWVFTIDAGNSGMTDNRVTVPGSSAKQITMTRGFDPLTAITYKTSATLPVIVGGTSQTHVAMLSGQTNGVISGLYLDYAGTDDPAKAIHYCVGQYTSSGAAGLFFLVNPISTGSRVGGGYYNSFVQPPTTSGSGTTANRVQQAPFYQINYRAQWASYSSDGATAPSHPTEWVRTYGKNGDTVLPGEAFNPWLDANHLRSASDPAANVRWGIVNLGESPSSTTAATLVPASIGGPSGADDVGFENFLYDLPRPGRSFASLGQLQHFNPSGFITATSYGTGGAIYNANLVHSWQVNYPISNSYPHPRVERHRLFYYTKPFSYHFDGSYLWNDLLWDRFFFSTFPQTGSFDFGNITDRLVNARLRPFRDRTTTAWDNVENFRGNGNAATAANSRKAAQNLLVDGAFNINSTSVAAWKALLSSLRNVPVGTEATPSAPFARTLYSKGGSTNAENGRDSNSFNGLRDLTPAQVEDIAEEIVMQVRKRGPFLSLSEFVNRKLIASAGDPLRLGLGGALQSAIDHVVNQKSEVTAPLNNTVSTDMSVNALVEAAYIMPTGISGFPGYLLQGDVLSALGSSLSARSDTFTIRTYGDSVNPATGDVTARAWCEAVVQRLPDYVRPESVAGGNTATDTTGLHADNQTFGRRYQIVSFRWLGPEDI